MTTQMNEISEIQKVRERRAGDRRVKRTEKAIRDAVLNLLKEYDFEKITVTAVAREADIDRKTFYLHYSSIEEVLEDIIREDIDDIVGLWREESEDQGGVESVANIGNVFSSVCILLVQDFQMSGQILDHLDPERLLSMLEAPLTDAIIENDVLGISAAMGSKLSYGVSFFCSGLLSVFGRWLQEDSEVPLEELVSMTSTLVASGVEGILRDSQQEQQKRDAEGEGKGQASGAEADAQGTEPKNGATISEELETDDGEILSREYRYTPLCLGI